jgi:hypothetical protein
MSREETPDVLGELMNGPVTKPAHKSTPALVNEQSQALSESTNTSSTKRKNPQVCCKVTPEDYAFLNELTVSATVKLGKSANISLVLRSIIQLARDHKNELKF